MIELSADEENKLGDYLVQALSMQVTKTLVQLRHLDNDGKNRTFDSSH